MRLKLLNALPLIADMKTARSRTAGPQRTRQLSAAAASAKLCAARFTTFERIQLRDINVVKSGGATEPFDRDKLARSIQLACRKRAIDPVRIERLVSGIQRQLETSGESETPSQRIGELAMEGLKGLDSVAYIRFAGVYKDFTEAGISKISPARSAR